MIAARHLFHTVNERRAAIITGNLGLTVSVKTIKHSTGGTGGQSGPARVNSDTDCEREMPTEGL